MGDQMFLWVLDGFSQDHAGTHANAASAHEFDEVSAIYIGHPLIAYL